MQRRTHINVGDIPVIAPGAEISVFSDSGLTTLATIYEDDEVTPAANPVIADVDGEFHYRAANGTYYEQIAGESAAQVTFFDPEDGLDSVVYNNPYYNDHRILLTGINPVGPAAAPVQDPAGEGWLFSPTVDNVAVLVTQMPHDWAEGTTIRPHIHWQKTTAAAGNVQWRLSYDKASPGGDFSGAYSVLATVNTPVAATVDNNTTTRHLITSFGLLSMAGETLSAVIKFKLERLGSTGGASDDYAANALALSFDFHYQLDSPGSATEFEK